MTRILVADDERPVVDGISLIVRRDLADEFEVAGAAASGREAIERAAELKPDIVLMDVRMPGISGLDAIREIRRRGSATAFILITAYERFDIAREAVELGVLDYLLKPVSKDRLARALRSAAESIRSRAEIERREMEHLEREEGQRPFVESAFLLAVMLGERSPSELAGYARALGLACDSAMAAAAAFLPPAGAPDPDAEARAAHEAFRRTLRYKTSAIAGPLESGLCAVAIPLRRGRPHGAAGAEEEEAFREAVQASHAEELSKGRIVLGFGRPRPLARIADSWSEALLALRSSARPPAQSPAEGAEDREDSAEEWPAPDGPFLAALESLSPERASLALEAVLASIPAGAVDPRDRYGLVYLFGAAYSFLARRRLLPPAEARELMGMADLGEAADAGALALAARARLSRIVAALRGASRGSPAVAASVAYVKENFGKPLTLESAADLVGLSPSRLSRIFAEEMGRGFSEFLIEYRIERAKEMLSEPGSSVKQVSAACGYPDPNYFSRLFKKETGLTPSAFSTGLAEANDEQ